MRIDPAFVEQQIASLIREYPELEDDEQLRADMVEGSTDCDEMLTAIEKRRQEAAAMAGAVATQIDDLDIRQRRFEAREKAMRTFAHRILDAAGLKKRELPIATFSVRAGTPRVVIVNEEWLPDEFVRVKREPDKTAIKASLVIGMAVPGAALSNGEPTLSVRVK